jgi:HTH-type transcriptional repressor of NAD biosynthesis genes
VLGAESTGTTTLAKALAARLQTIWVPEYGREYSAAKLERGEAEWRSEEFVEIAREQNRREEQGAREANRVVICDTDSFATKLWHRRYVGGENAGVDQLAAERRCDLYLLTGDEIPFVQDGLRDGEHLRHEMHQWFVDALKAQAVPWRLLRGPHQTRLGEALDAVCELFRDSGWRPPV